MREARINEIKGILLFALSLIVFASLVSFVPEDLAFYTSHPNIPAHNLIRGFGAHLAGILLFLIGWASWLLPVFMLSVSLGLFKQRALDFRLVRILGLIILTLAISSLLAMLASQNASVQFSWGGLFGFIFSSLLVTYFGKLGAYIIFITLAILSLALVFEILVSRLFIKMTQRMNASIIRPLFGKRKVVFSLRKKPEQNQRIPSLIKEPLISVTKPRIQIEKPQEQVIEKLLKPGVQKREVSLKPEDIKEYQPPTLDLLDSPPPLAERKIKEDLSSCAHILEETLADFGISVKVTDIERGPVITRYELEPAPGVKLNRIVSLSDDIALTMKAQSVRIVAPIPGKGRVGVEVPNIQSSLVYLKEVLAAEEFQVSSSKLTLALGKDIAGKPIVADLTDMPHLLIAGTTGSGKTVCVNCLILSILFRATPEEVKFLMVDPKMVELAPFNNLPHLLCPVVTEGKKVATSLAWVVNEMEERYRLFAKEGKRNIEAYNESHERIPYIIVIIDELADLMAVASVHVESAITRLAQLSRAVGIHLILATQRPSVDVVTGVIKANFPARISFQVASKVDSRTVLDTNGADKLLGRGDMLFLKPGESKLIRAQGSLVNDIEIERVVEFIKAQRPQPVYVEGILKEEETGGFVSDQRDELYDGAVRLVMESGQASVSILQRRMRLGYTRAARIIDTMEQEGLIGPFEGSKPRRILINREDWLKEKIWNHEAKD